MVQDVIDDGAEENVADFPRTATPQDEELELVAVGDPADEGAGRTEFQPRLRSHSRLGEESLVMTEQLFAGPAGVLPDHGYLEVWNHPVGEAVDIGDVKEDQGGGKPIPSGDNGLDGFFRGFRVIDGNENFRCHASSPGQK